MMKNTMTMNNIRVRNLVSYLYLPLLLLTMVTAKITVATPDKLCKISSNQILFEEVTLKLGADFGELEMKCPINTNSYDVNMYVCLKENSQLVAQPCVWEKLVKMEQSGNDSSLTAVVKFSENLDCSYCLVKWVLAQNNTSAKEYAGCTRVVAPGNYNLMAEGSGYFNSDETTQKTTITTTEVSTTTSTTEKPSKCRPVGLYKTIRGMQEWCENNCQAGYCPPSHCKCDKGDTMTCEVTNSYKLVPGMKQWCLTNCQAGYCPKTHCKCSKTTP